MSNAAENWRKEAIRIADAYAKQATEIERLRAALTQLVKDIEDGEPHDEGLDMARVVLKETK